MKMKNEVAGKKEGDKVGQRGPKEYILTFLKKTQHLSKKTPKNCHAMG